MQIYQVAPELFHADGRAGGRAGGRTDGQTDRYNEANRRFSQFCKLA